jgi:4a-hydroxytetrahydrobiopterin dehydratase
VIEQVRNLENLDCIPCRRGDPEITADEINEFISQLPDWRIVNKGGINQLVRAYKFKNFIQALDFTVNIGQLAESKGHHPSITTEWGKVTITWWTHAINGLHINDFVMAAKSDLVYFK